MALIVFQNEKDILVADYDESLVLARFHPQLLENMSRESGVLDDRGASNSRGSFLAFRSSHPVFQIMRRLDEKFGVVRRSLSSAVLRGPETASRQQLINALTPLELSRFSDQEINSFQKKLLQSLWQCFRVEGLGAWYLEIKKSFLQNELVAGYAEGGEPFFKVDGTESGYFSRVDAADAGESFSRVNDEAKRFVKKYFPDFSVSVMDKAVDIFRKFAYFCARENLSEQERILTRISEFFTDSYSLDQQEDDTTVQSIKELLMGLLVLVGPKFKIDAVCSPEDKVVIVSANSADQVGDIPFVQANLPFSTVESLKKLYESDEYLKLIIQQYLALGISPIELLIVLHNNDLCHFERGSDGVQYLLKLIDHPVLTEACAREMLGRKNFSSQLMSIIADVGSSVPHEYKVSSVFLERLQQISSYWLKIPDIFEILGISDVAEKYSQALLVLAAMLKQANLFNTSMQTHQYTKCTRFAKYLAYVALSPTNVLAMTISSVTGQQQEVKPEDIVASVLTIEQLQFAIRREDVSRGRFRFNQEKGLTVYIETDNLQIDPAGLVNILLQRCCKLTKADGLMVNPLLWDPSFVEKKSNDGNYTASVFAVATEHWIAGSSHLKVWSYNRSTHIEGAADFEGSFCSFGDSTQAAVPTIVNDFSFNDDIAGRIHVLRIKMPADSTVVYSGKPVAFIPGGLQNVTLPMLDINSLFQDALAQAAKDHYLLSNFIWPLRELIPSLVESVDRRRALSVLATVNAQVGDYYRYLEQVIERLSPDVARAGDLLQLQNTINIRLSVIKAVLRRGAVRRTIDGRIVNSSDEWRALYNLMVLTTALIFPQVWKSLGDDPFLADVTQDPKLIEIVIKSILPAVLVLLVLTFGSTLPLLYQLGAGILSPLRRRYPGLFDRGMDADVKAVLIRIENSSTNAALISLLAAIITEKPFEVEIGNTPLHSYELLDGLFRELMSRRNDPLAHHLLVMLTSRREERRDVGPREYWLRMSVLRPASQVIVPGVLLGLASATMHHMYSTLYSKPVQDNDTPLLKFLAIAGILLNTPGVPLGLIFLVLLHLMERSFDFDFFKLKVIDNCLYVLDAVLVQPVRRVGNKVATCIGSAGAFATRGRIPVLESSLSVNDDPEEREEQEEQTPLLPK